MKELKRILPYQELREGIQKRQSIHLHGLIPEAYPLLLASLFKETQENFLVLTENERSAKKLAEAVNLLIPGKAYWYPAQSMNFYNLRSLDDEGRHLRLKTLMALAEKRPMMVISSLRALRNKISTNKAFQKECFRLDLDFEGEIEEISKKLLFLRYRPVQRVEAVGDFSVRGGILDIFPAHEELPVRIEFFDTQIDSIRKFSVEDQRSLENIQEVSIGPATEIIFSAEELEAAGKGLSQDLSQGLKKTGVDLNRLEDKFSNLLDSVNTGNYLENTELLLPYLKAESYGILTDYFEIVFTMNLDNLYTMAQGEERAFMEDVSYQMEKGEAMDSHQRMVFSTEEIFGRLRKKTLVNLELLMKSTKLFTPEKLIYFQGIEAEKFHRKLDLFLERIEAYVKEGYKIYLYIGDSRRQETILKLLQEKNFPIFGQEKGSISLCSENLSGGVIFPQGKVVIFTMQEIFGRSKEQKPVSKKKKDNFLRAEDLKPGDFVVHESYGIGRFENVVQEERQGIRKDYLLIAYGSGDRLYIPTDQLNLIQKYIGAGADKEPKLSRLSTAEWTKTKRRAKKILEEIAEDLVRLYAKRETVQGFAFSPDDAWQREFEDSFPYEETPSQLESLEEIKKDMEAPKPMDRVLCGDVGYGKTEVALRAAFKAILDGKQVAFLVPTTILAEQHYRTALERFAKQGVEVEMLSRFRTPSKQKEIMKRAQEGQVDLIIGTHRLLSKDMKYKDLGLLIIDEEQRFGVRHKEKIKSVQEKVDVLTLSATPIPRTLQMGLVGIRDMSYLTEPPGERFPVTTYVTEFHENLIAQALRRELDRKGQVYFVYNNVAQMEKMYQRIYAMVPGAKIAIGHGQMSERELEKVMRSFVDGEIDILLCSTIIETGMDIHNVNTLVIYEADRMGLSQLYQLKGRIGRGNRAGYAYFTYPEGKVLTEIAQKRLLAIRDFTAFGSGFKIAMRDLELRGAGNLLGESQSGHIEAIGYELYVKYMEQALKKVKGEEIVPEEKEFTVELAVDAYIPTEYISDMDQKLEMYKKIADIGSVEDKERLYEEMTDRFSEVPSCVVNLMEIAYLKVLGKEAGFTSIKGNRDTLTFHWDTIEACKPLMVAELNRILKDKIHFALTQKPSVQIKINKNALNTASDFLGLVNRIKSGIMKKNS